MYQSQKSTHLNALQQQHRRTGAKMTIDSGSMGGESGGDQVERTSCQVQIWNDRT
jgi:hypothetical protein